ncbi:MAG: hypothetical protein QOE61_4711 [Micromonosporaceae bacterium]|nr:hypothetical protein [Micromonosporaceae bacterium]
MGEPLRMPVDALRRHAATVDRLAELVETSHAAAGQVYLDRGSYGVMCQFMPQDFEPGMQDTVDGLAGSVRELHTLAAALRSAANAYESTDTTAADRVRDAVATMRLPL